jgi:outer membrane lipoprotein-sorting protein
MFSPEFRCRPTLPKALPWILLTLALLLVAPKLSAGVPVSRHTEALAILARMDAAYAEVAAYQTDMEVREYRKGKYQESKRFGYSFKKPNRLRIDMKSPKPGTVLVYPDRGGKVTLRPGGWSGVVTLHLAPDNALLASGSGQRIDQSDFGLLLRNLRHSLSDGRRGEIEISEAGNHIAIEVLAQDHYLPGVQTLYRFVVDPANWLPLEISESTPQGSPKRKSIFGNLRTSVVLEEAFFRLD